MKNSAYKASVVHNDILGGKQYPVKYYVKHSFTELWEVIEALAKLNLKEAKLEAQQVIFGLEMWLYQTTKKDFDMFFCNGAIEEFYYRRTVWLELFGLFDLEFRSEYLDNGSNFRRPHKIRQAFFAAGMYLHELHARLLSRKYIKQEMNHRKKYASKN